MKKSAVILCFVSCLTAGAAGGQEKYTLYRVNGEVTVRKAQTTTWQTAQKRMEVEPADYLRIGKNSEAAVLDNTTNLIYPSGSSGTSSVRKIIEEGKRKDDRAASLVAKEMWNTITETGRGTNTYAMGGFTVRNPDKAGATRAIYNALHRLIERVVQGEAPTDVRFGVTRISVREAGCRFAVHNDATEPWVVNILCINRQTGTASICVATRSSDYQLVIPVGEKVEIPYTFATETPPGTVYVLFAVQESYDVKRLQEMLSHREPRQGSQLAKILATTIE